MNSPIVLFTFNRLNLLKKTIKCLQRNYLAIETDLVVFSDGHKDEKNLQEIIAIRNFLKKVNGFKSILIIEREENLGLEKNIILGLDYIFSKYEKVIVLEDDIITSKYFLNFMNDSLLKYESYKDVCQISGYSFLEKYQNQYKLDDLYFIKGADCLAWGTWKDRWKSYTNDSENLAKQIINKKLKREFNRDNAYNFYKMLKSKSRNNNSWAICWYAINFLKNKYTLYPLRSFACHIGNDSNATNYISPINDPLDVKIYKKQFVVKTIEINEKEQTFFAYNKFLKDSKGSLYERIKCYLKVFMRENLSLNEF